MPLWRQVLSLRHTPQLCGAWWFAISCPHVSALEGRLMLILETFGQLFRDPAHWQFELLVSAIEQVFGFVVVSLLTQKVVWPRVKQHFHHDIEDAGKSASGGWPITVTDKHGYNCEHSDGTSS